MSPQYLDHQIRRLLKRSSNVRNDSHAIHNLPAKKREAAERALNALASSDVVPLFNEPANSRGEFVVLPEKHSGPSRFSQTIRRFGGGFTSIVTSRWKW